MEYPKFKVCCRCFTFNQAKYITDAMNGFTMQQTSFPFVCCIVDDASTDGEQDVIRKYVEENFDFSEGSVSYHKETGYAHIAYAQHKTNKNCFFAVLYLKENHYSQRKPKMGYLSEWRDMCEYEALCEGDDYWIVPDKLEKQVDYLDKHNDYSMCFHNAYIHYEGKSNDKLFAFLDSREYLPQELIEKWLIPTASMLYRMNFASYVNDLNIDTKKIIFGDNLLTLVMLHYGKLFAFSDIMSVYRKHEGGAVFSISEIQHERFYQQLRYSQIVFPEFSNYLKYPIGEKCFHLSLKTLRHLKLPKFCYWFFLSFYYSPRAFFDSLFKLFF